MREPSNVHKTTIDVEVRYAETDQMGVVHHANYVVWLELARTHLCEASGFHYAEIEAMGFFLMVTGVALRYRRPARYGDIVQVECWTEELMSRGVRFGYDVKNNGEVLATGSSDHIWVERASGRPCRPPESLRGIFEQLAGVGAPKVD